MVRGSRLCGVIAIAGGGEENRGCGVIAIAGGVIAIASPPQIRARSLSNLTGEARIPALLQRRRRAPENFLSLFLGSVAPVVYSSILARVSFLFYSSAMCFIDSSLCVSNC